jgi:hypothetical protein
MLIELTHTVDRSARDEQVLSALVHDAYDAELRDRVSDCVDRQLDVFFAIQSVPSRTVLLAA